MDNLCEDFGSLKISALKKVCKINSYVHNVTLGPDSIIKEAKKHEKSEKREQVKNETVIISPAGKVSPVKKILVELEVQRQEDVQEAIDFRHKQILNFQKWQKSEQKEQWFRQQQKMIQQMQQQEYQILQALDEHDKDLSIRHEKLVRYYQELADRRKKKGEELQAKELRKQELHGIIDKIKKDQIEFRSVYQDIVNNLKASEINDSLKKLLTETTHQLKTLPTSMEEVIAKCKMGKISENEAERSSELLHQLNTVRFTVLKIIEDHNNREERAKAQEKMNEVKPKNPLESIDTQPLPVKNVEPNRIENKENVTAKIDKYVGKPSLRIYLELQQFLQNHEVLYKELTSDESLKQFKFDCKKAVNIPVNAISAINSYHLLDKYNRLSNLLSGKTVQIGDLYMSASKHSEGIAFCMNLLAKKFVLQGDLMISSNPEAAFCYAAVILALWIDYPDFGKLLLAHFHKQCPYLVPFYIPKAVDQPDEEHYINLGYQYNDGIIEKQDKFLKRMTGIMRLYSAILIAKPKRGQPSMHPHGLPQAWRWLASILNLEPRTDITATLLYVFLETTGFALQSVYGKEFKRIVYFIMEWFLPILKKIDSGGPVTRLEVLLQEYKQRGSFEPPSGLLPSNFW